jgi:predicted AAA+ superfamily ATPase
MQQIARNGYRERAKSLLAAFPVLAVMGPRQCGKTTFAKSEFAEYEYLDLELYPRITRSWKVIRNYF